MPSIKDLVPLDISGRHARKGFCYQDHIAAGLCIDFLNDSNLKEIWLESHDDILLFWEDKGALSLEFIQVKAVDQPSRWSVPLITGNGNIKDAIIKKQLDQDRCLEPVKFRIVSSYDVNVDLAVLKETIGSKERLAKDDKEKELEKLIVDKLGDLKSPNGKKIGDWIKLCWWEKKADKIDDLVNSNKISLEVALNTLGRPIFSDQRDEIYQKLLSYCQAASSGDIKTIPDCYKILREKFIEWLTTTIDSLYTPTAGLTKLEEKLKKAKNVPDDYIANAKQSKWDYIKKRLNNDYIQPSDLHDLESEVHGALYQMKIALDNDEVDEENFHKLCLNKLNEIRKSKQFKDKNIPEYLILGYMYDLTSKCIHRFRKVEL